MAEKIRINTKTLQNDTVSIQKYLKQVKKKIQDMQNDVEEMNQMWSGEANKSFNKTFNDDINAILAVCKSIEGIISYENTANTEYNNCENKVASMIASMNV